MLRTISRGLHLPAFCRHISDLATGAGVVALAAAMALGIGASRAGAGIADLRVNEFMAANHSGIVDEGGDTSDWVEIYNSGSTAVNMEGMFLTDTPLDSQRWEFPDTLLPSHGYLIVWCDNEPLEGPLHTTFALDADGEFVGLYEYLGIGNDAVDSTSFGQQARDVSYGRYPNGSGPYGYMPNPTPRAANLPPGNIPPFFEDTRSVPTIPSAGQQVTVTSKISDDSQIVEAKIYYSTGSGFLSTWLYDDGAHGDQQPGDGHFGGTIPGFPNYTHVVYYIWAQDDDGASATDPLDAPAETFSYFVGYEPPALYINEFMALNNTTITDEWGEYDDWVEIYNRTDTDISMGGMYLTDDPNDVNKYQFPDVVLPAREFMVIWCDNDPEQGPFHTDFGLSAAGEFVGLYDRDLYNRAAIDSLSFVAQSADISYGRFPNGGSTWRYYSPATPFESNTDSGVDDESSGLAGLRILALTNPATGFAALRYEAPAAGPLRFAVYDATGRKLMQARWATSGGIEDRNVDLGSLGAGVYFLRLDVPGSSAGCRLTVVR